MNSAIRSYKERIKESLVNNLSSIFPDSKKRLTIWAETEKYRFGEDESVWNQEKGKTAPQYEATFDREFVCFIDSSKSDKYNISEFLINIRKLYNDGKIFVHPEMYEIKKAQQESENKDSELIVPKPVNEAEDIIVQTIKKQAKKRKRKIKLK